MKLTQVDITLNYADAAVWSAVEASVAVISVYPPMLRPMVRLASGTIGSIGSLGKNCGHVAGTAGTGSNDQPHWRSSHSADYEGWRILCASGRCPIIF